MHFISETSFMAINTRSATPRTRFPFLSGFEGTYIFGSGVDVLDTTEHSRRFGSDFAELGRDGLSSFRACIPWHHIERNKGAYDWSWCDEYLSCARQRGLDPIADLLHHTSFPDWLAGGFADAEFGERFLQFLAAFAKRYPFVTSYTIINEPYVTTWFCGNCAIWHPYRQGSENFVPMLSAVARTLCEATELLSCLVGEVRFVHTESCEFHVALDSSANQQARLGNIIRFCVL